MFPLFDDNPTLRTPIVTYGIIAACVLAWVLVQGMGAYPALERSVCQLGLIPAEFLGRLPAGFEIPMGRIVCTVGVQSTWYAPLTSMFLHGGWLHLIGNMWFLWVFGNNVEDSVGRVRYLVFYLLCGLAAVAAQILSQPASEVPMVGASGAIGGVMGAYVALYPRVRVHMLVFLVVFITRIVLPAYVVLGYWFLLQVLGGLPALQAGAGSGGVAFWAHVGGFLAGVILIQVFRNPELVARHRAMIAASQWQQA